jgi:23S rRNA (cytidine1920-2'-O)/16S rRNA (cytidine1409-2'-O)-methyltransferase
VGRGQLDLSLRNDPRVTVRERTNVRHLTGADVGGPFELVVADLAFISLRTVAPALLGLAGPGADLILLVKPQFEAGRVEASRERGVIRDPQVWHRALQGVIAAYAAGGAAIMGLMISPLLGAEGNVEFLAHLVAGAATAGDPAALIADSVAAALARGVEA